MSIEEQIERGARAEMTVASLLAIERSLRLEVERLRARLPAEMQTCTIVFKECEKGHGRLTATNWIDHGCSQCAIDRLREPFKYADAVDWAYIEHLLINAVRHQQDSQTRFWLEAIKAMRSNAEQEAGEKE